MENDGPKDKKIDKAEESEPKPEKNEKPEFTGIRFVEDVPSSNQSDDVGSIKNEPDNSEQKIEPVVKESVPLEAAEPEMPEAVEPEIVEPEHKSIEVEKLEKDEPLTTVSSVSSEVTSAKNGDSKSVENVTYDERPAGFWLRFTAFQLDGYIVGVITLFVSLALASVLAVDGINFGAGFLEVVNQYLIYSSEKQNYLLMNIVAIIIPLVYSVGFLVAKGASPGKMLLCIKVKRESGDGRLSILNAFLRTIGYIVSSLPFLLGFLWAGFSRQKKAWHDVLASTKVVKYKKISFLRVILAYFLPIFPYFILPAIFIQSFSMESMEGLILNSSKVITTLVGDSANKRVVEMQLSKKPKPLGVGDVQKSKEEVLNVSDSVKSAAKVEMPMSTTGDISGSAGVGTDESVNSAGSVEHVVDEDIQTVEDISVEAVTAPELLSDKDVIESGGNDAVGGDVKTDGDLLGDGEKIAVNGARNNVAGIEVVKVEKVVGVVPDDIEVDSGLMVQEGVGGVVDTDALSMISGDGNADDNISVTVAQGEEESLTDEVVSMDVGEVVLESGGDDESWLSPQVLLDGIDGEDKDNVLVEVVVDRLSDIAMDAKPVAPEDVAANRIDVRIEPLVVERPDEVGTQFGDVEVEIAPEVLTRDGSAQQEEELSLNNKNKGVKPSLNEELARKYFEIGRGYHQKGNIVQAEQFFKNAIKVEPDFVEARITLAHVYEKQGLYDNSIEEHNEVVRIDPRRVKAHIDLGYLFYLKGDKLLAIESVKKAIEIEPENTEAHILLGVVYQKFEMFDDAIKSHKRALKINSDLAVPHLNIGNIFYKKRNDRKAVKAYKTAIKIDPGLVEARNNLGYIYYSRGKNEKAIYELKKAIELKYEYKRAHKNLSLAYKRAGMVDAAIKEDFIASSLP